MTETQNNNKINVLSENMVSKSCLKLHDYHDQWCNAEGIYAFFFLQSISTNPKDMFFIVSSSTKRVGCLPREWGMNTHACAPQGLAFEQVKMWAAGKWLQIFPPCTKKLHDPLFKTLLPASTFTTHLQHIHSQPNTDLQPTLGCHLLDSCQSN